MEAFCRKRGIRNAAQIDVYAAETAPMGSQTAGSARRAATKRVYPVHVRPWLAAVLVLVTATVTMADPLFCADGCDQRPLTFQQPNVSGSSDDCVTCQIPLSPRVEAPAQPVPQVIVQVTDPDESSVSLCDLSPLDQPPRSA